jgi:hypothetical protein
VFLLDFGALQRTGAIFLARQVLEINLNESSKNTKNALIK